MHALKRPNETYHAQWRVWAEREVPAYGPVNSKLANHQMPISRLVPIGLPLPGNGLGLYLDYHDTFGQILYSRGRIRCNLRDWAIEALREAGQRPAAHHLLLLAELEHLSNGPADRLLVLMPPGSAKSTYASVLFPAWWFTQHPQSSIITASHSSSLASHFSRRVRFLILTKSAYLGFSVAREQRSTEAWSTTNGGDYFSIGVRGAIVGRRADLIVVDDPVRSQADAESAQQRDYIWEWFKTDLTTRLRPSGKIVLIMTRWHPDDLAGQLLARARSQWRVISLPALAEIDDPLRRPEGAPLWPEWEDRQALMRKRELIGERAWSALFQQDPHPAGGKLFSVDRLAIIDRPGPSLLKSIIRAWDLAATGATGQNDPDWTVGLKLAQQNDGRYVVLSVLRLRGTPRQVEDLIVEYRA